jgi:hypothetical protein
MGKMSIDFKRARDLVSHTLFDNRWAVRSDKKAIYSGSMPTGTCRPLFSGAPGQVWLVGIGGNHATLKFEIGTQQVQVLSSQGLANQLVASLTRRRGDPRREA